MIKNIFEHHKSKHNIKNHLAVTFCFYSLSFLQKLGICSVKVPQCVPLFLNTNEDFIHIYGVTAAQREINAYSTNSSFILMTNLLKLIFRLKGERKKGKLLA